MKKNTLLLFGILTATLSSCVYSLFPIYTEDTLVFKKELLGKWLMNVEGSDYMLFEAAGPGNDEKQEKSHKFSLEVEEGFVLSSDEPIFIIRNGVKIYDEEKIREELKGTWDKVKPEVREKEAKKSMFTDSEFKGKISMNEGKSYRLTVHQNNTDEIYSAHLVQIGDDLFLDLYPEVEYNANFSENFFPVHTFFKLAVSGNKLEMTMFDLEKLNKLFESNLIRLRHENVNGTILITAQPEELQKFFDKYADDNSVFEETETYSRAS